MQNYFDFYVIMAHSDSKKALKQIPNLHESEIVKTYDYSGRWPKPSYSARLSFIDVMGQPEAAKEMVDAILAALPKINGIQYHAKYVARD